MALRLLLGLLNKLPSPPPKKKGLKEEGHVSVRVIMN